MDELLLTWQDVSDSPTFLFPVIFRNSPLKNGITVWSRGYIANDSELVAQYNLPSQSSHNEVLSALCDRIGVEGTARALAGTCSWIVWEAKRQSLTLVSDHVGLEPLYFSWHAGRLWVASDPELILHYSGIPRQENPAAIVARIGGLPVPAGQTLFENISVLPSATVWSYAQGKIRQEQYWQLKMQPTLRLKDDGEYAEALRTLLIKVVDEHVPTGEFALTLSSGMDSSSIAGALRLARPQERIPSIGWAMPDFPPPINEEERICATSAKLDLELTTIQADQYWPLKPMETPDPIPLLGVYQEAWIATFQKMRQRGWRTLIMGALGDVCFGNFISSYPDLFISFRWRDVFKQICCEIKAGYHKRLDWKTPLRLILKPLFLYLEGGQTGPGSRVPVWLHASKLDLYAQLKRNYRPLRRLGLPARVERWRQISYPAGIQNLVQYQKLARHFGIELRHPFSDHRVLEFALSLPSEQTYRAGMHKFIMRNAMRDLLPEAVVNFRQKILPIRLFDRGLRERSLEQARALMTNMRLAEMGYVLPQEIEATYQLFLDKKNDRSDFFYTLMLESQLRAWN
ncbi:MAG: asparagine synthase-related protein [Chloroflexota bacterium]